jgi:hypothetical protein
LSTAFYLSLVPTLRGNWVALDPAPRANDETLCTLRSGAAVVDADENLDVLCRRIKAARKTSLTIVFAS